MKCGGQARYEVDFSFCRHRFAEIRCISHKFNTIDLKSSEIKWISSDLVVCLLNFIQIRINLDNFYEIQEISAKYLTIYIYI